MKTISLLIKPVSGSCNVRCRYCFYSCVSDTRTVKNYGVMSVDILEIIIKKALNEAEHYAAFAFQGGEPTMAGIDFFKTFVAFVHRYNVNGIKVSYALQTNGLLIDTQWAEFFKENKFLIGLSMDGTKDNHDYCRIDAAGKGTHNRAMAAMRVFTKYGVDVNILSVITRQFARHPDAAYNFYKKNGCRYLQFIPCLDDLNVLRGSHDYSLDANDYGDFLCRMFDLWHTDFIKNDYVSIRIFDNYIHMLMGQPPESCAMAGACAAYALIEADGSVYPCDFYASDDYFLGNINECGFTELLHCESAKVFAESSRHVDAACLQCEFYFLCRGGCRRDRESADGQLLLNHYCESYKQFFAHAMPRMHAIAQSLLKR